MALALGARWAAERVGLVFEAVVVDHALQEGSGEVAAATVAALNTRGIEARVQRVAVSEGNLEAEARTARLAALTAPGLPVLLGHTMDDQAETVLLALARGSGLDAISGMAPVRGPLRRPLLGLRRSVTERACEEWGVQAWADPHNTDQSFARVRVRTRGLPALEDALGPGIVESLARTADLARLESAALADLTPLAPEEPDVAWLVQLPEAIRGRCLKGWLQGHCGAVTKQHVEQVARLVTHWRGQVGVDVPGGRVVRTAGRLVWVPNHG